MSDSFIPPLLAVFLGHGNSAGEFPHRFDIGEPISIAAEHCRAPTREFRAGSR